MKKLKLIKQLGIAAVAVFTIGGALANWVEISRNDDLIHYVETSTIEKTTGGTIRVWTMQDFLNNKKPALSMTGLQEFNCHEKRVKLHHAIAYSKNMRQGDVLLNKAVNFEWKHIAPGTFDDLVMRVLCN